MQGIPIEHLAKMGSYSIKMQGVNVEVKVVDVDCLSLLETHINDMRTAALKTSPIVLGADIKRFSDPERKNRISSDRDSLVLCWGAANCLIIHLHDPYTRARDYKIPQVLMKFLKDPTICFVGTTNLRTGLPSDGVVGPGALAAMVLKKPTLTKSSLQVVSREVGVHYDGPSTGTKEIAVDSWNPLVLTPEQVKLAVTDAYAYYNIGHKLLASL